MQLLQSWLSCTWITFPIKQLVQVVQTPTQLKEQLYLHEDMTDPFRGYSAVKSAKKLVKYLERVQSQYNIAEDKVNICSPQGYCKIVCLILFLRHLYAVSLW